MDVPLSAIDRYEEKVYAGLLGKTAGVYLGRPFEGWSHRAIADRWGFVDRYVHEDLGRPLVVADDDLSGTLTFVRALEDSGLYGDTPEAFFGDTWRNYIMEGRTVLWWGGRGNSTEHTAFLNLAEGVPAPQSGSAARNGRTVAEQIGAQIFIDAFGWVAPGRPRLAAELARRAARVAHDGEAVHAACAVAAMNSAAFVETRMSRLLDIGAGVLPAGSLIARVHRDVRAWAARDGDWRRTFARIERRYGYDRYGGNCHVVPNHAVMVLAWASAPRSFRRALGIAATCGWDTDCNCGNVGAVLGVALGRDGIDAEYEFQAPFADRLILPTAEGARAATDVAAEAGRVAAIGRRLAGAPEPRPRATRTHGGFAFALPGARHGFAVEEGALAQRGTARLTSAARRGQQALVLDYVDLVGDRVARICTPVFPDESGARYGGSAQIQATPRLYPGMGVCLRGRLEVGDGQAEATLFARCYEGETRQATAVVRSPARRLRPGAAVTLRLTVPQTGGWPVKDLGLEVRPRGAGRASGRFVVEAVALTGRARVALAEAAPLGEDGGVLGWVCDADRVRNHPFSDDGERVFRLGKDRGRGLMATGTEVWRDVDLACRVSVHSGGAGLLVRYGGLQRYAALGVRGDRLQLVERRYGDRVLAEVHIRPWASDALHPLRLGVRGRRLRAWLDGDEVLSGITSLSAGGAGLFVDSGLAGFRDLVIE